MMTRLARPGSPLAVSGGLLTLVGEIYDAALDLSRWPRVLNALCEMSRSDAVLLVIEDARARGRPQQAKANDEEAPVDCCQNPSAVWASDRLFGKSLAGAQRALGAHLRKVSRGSPSRDKADEKFYTFCVEVLSDETARTHVAGWRARGDVEVPEATTVLEPLLPHLRRAIEIMLWVKSVDQRSGSATASLDRVPQPVVLIDSNRRVMFANRAASRVFRRRDGLTVEGGKLRAMTDRGRDALERIYKESSRPATSDAWERTFPMELPSLREPLEILGVPFVPLNTLGIDDERAPLALFIVDPAGPEIEEQTLCELFGLTAAEARVAAALVSGLTLAEASRQLGIGVTTARWHLSHVFAKTNTSRQPELVSVLLLGVATVERS